MDTADLDRYARFAEELADEARAILRARYRSGLTVETKADASPVTEADREVERRLRERIRAAYPDHGVLGEEGGGERVDAEWVWVLDPIDGTRSFTVGRPLYTSLVALVRDGRPVVGVIEAPATEERWVGVLGRPTRHDGAAVRVRAERALAEAVAFAGNPTIPAFDDAERAALERFAHAAGWALFEGDAYAYGLLARGDVDVVAECHLDPEDACALVPVVEGAGGVIRQWNGEPVTLGACARVVAASGAGLAEAAARVLGGGAG